LGPNQRIGGNAELTIRPQLFWKVNKIKLYPKHVRRWYYGYFVRHGFESHHLHNNPELLFGSLGFFLYLCEYENC
jgi:hypothetical protein